MYLADVILSTDKLVKSTGEPKELPFDMELGFLEGDDGYYVHIKNLEKQLTCKDCIMLIANAEMKDYFWNARMEE